VDENPGIGGAMPVPKRMIIAITGASGVIYGIHMLRALQKTPYETHLIISEAGSRNIDIETGFSPDEIKEMADYTYLNTDVGAALASGSFITEGMTVIPCTIKTLSGIANCYADNLIIRAADVTLKEKRKLLLVVRETPLHQGHLRLMTMAANMGAYLLPPVPSFYHQPKTIDDIIDHTIGKIFDYFKIEHDLFKRWGQ
jgi:4-hydroxy-3-polyprenylbenzoate decarboxylase